MTFLICPQWCATKLSSWFSFFQRATVYLQNVQMKDNLSRCMSKISETGLGFAGIETRWTQVYGPVGWALRGLE
jgi:hypothetical protein